MIDPFIVAIAIFFMGFFGARFIQESALKELDQNQKGLLIEALAGVRKYTLYAVIAIVGIVLLVMYTYGPNNALIFWIYLCALFVLMLFTVFNTRKILKEHQFPNSYITKYIWGACVRYFSIGVFFIVLINSGKLSF